MADVLNTKDENSGVRLVTLCLPEDAGEGLGFRLTRTQWDPYPWVREVVANTIAETAGLTPGDCLIQAQGNDLLGMPVSQVANIIRGDGHGGEVSLLVWNCGVNPSDDPELIWSVGGGSRGEQSRRALAGVIRALNCCVCSGTVTKAYNCARSHLYCEGCFVRLDRCALCRETLPQKDSAYAKNLVAQQVFEAIASEYDLKNSLNKSSSSTNQKSPSPNRNSLSPNLNTEARLRTSSLTTPDRGQYMLSMMKKRQLNSTNYHSDTDIHRSVNNQQTGNPHTHGNTIEERLYGQQSSPARERNENQNGGCSQEFKSTESLNCNCKNRVLKHKLVTNLRAAYSLVDLQNSAVKCNSHHHNGSMEELKCSNKCCEPILLLQPPVILLSCDHETNNLHD